MLGEEDGLDTPSEAFLGDGLGQIPKLFGGTMVSDEHRRNPGGGRATASS